jgi:hypothetical protein
MTVLCTAGIDFMCDSWLRYAKTVRRVGLVIGCFCGSALAKTRLPSISSGKNQELAPREQG